MSSEAPAYGLWSLVVLNVLVFTMFVRRPAAQCPLTSGPFANPLAEAMIFATDPLPSVCESDSPHT